MGRRWGFGLREKLGFVRRLLSDQRMHRVQGWFERYGNFTVFLGRQVAGVRFVTFFTAGTMRMPLWRFVLFDFLGCLVSVPVWLGLGYFAAQYGREWLRIAMGRVSGGFFLASLALLVLFIMLFRQHRSHLATSNETKG